MNYSLHDAIARLSRRTGPAADAAGVARAAENKLNPKGTLLDDVLGMFKRDRSGVKFTPSSKLRRSGKRAFRRQLEREAGRRLSGRQWRKLRRALAAEGGAA